MKPIRHQKRFIFGVIFFWPLNVYSGDSTYYETSNVALKTYKQRYWRWSTQLVQDITNWVVFKKVFVNNLPKMGKTFPNPFNLKDKIFSWKHTTSYIKKHFHLLKQSREKNVINEIEYTRNVGKYLVSCRKRKSKSEKCFYFLAGP